MGRVEINTKIINKHDTEANWNSRPSFIPDKSEIIVYDKDDNYNYPRVKIGDGVTTVVALPFIVNAAVQDIGSLTIDLNNAESGTVPFTNSDMLGGLPASSYLQVADFPQALTDAGVVKSVAGKTPNANGEITLVPADIGAAASSHTHNYVPTSRTVNDKALSGDISLTYSDVGAAAASHTHDSIMSPDCLALTWSGDHMLSSTDRPSQKLHFGDTTLYRYNSSNNSYYPIYDNGNLTFSLSGTTLTITKS